MKKVLSLFLAVLLIASLTVGVSAKEPEEIKEIVLKADFDAPAVGQMPYSAELFSINGRPAEEFSNVRADIYWYIYDETAEFPFTYIGQPGADVQFAYDTVYSLCVVFTTEDDVVVAGCTCTIVTPRGSVTGVCYDGYKKTAAFDCYMESVVPRTPSGYVKNGENTHMLIIGDAVITTEHVADQNGYCVLCRAFVDSTSAEDIIIDDPVESASEEEEIAQPPQTGVILAALPLAASALAIMLFRKK